MALAPSMKSRDRQQQQKAMDDNWESIYELADLVCDRHMSTGKRATFVEGEVVDRVVPASIGFDINWKSKISQKQ